MTPCDLQRDEVPLRPLSLRLDQRVAAEELALVGMDEAVEAGFIGRIFDRQLARDEPVALLDRQRRHRLDAEGPDAEFPARLHQQVEDGVLLLDRMMQLPAELADEIDAQRMRAGGADADLLAGEPREGGVGEVGVGQLLQHLARARARPAPARPMPW